MCEPVSHSFGYRATTWGERSSERDQMEWHSNTVCKTLLHRVVDEEEVV